MDNDKGGRGSKNVDILRDVIYGWSLGRLLVLVRDGLQQHRHRALPEVLDRPVQNENTKEAERRSEAVRAHSLIS